jgi:hypothetical protein
MIKRRQNLRTAIAFCGSQSDCTLKSIQRSAELDDKMRAEAATRERFGPKAQLSPAAVAALSAIDADNQARKRAKLDRAVRDNAPFAGAVQLMHRARTGQ